MVSVEVHAQKGKKVLRSLGEAARSGERLVVSRTIHRQMKRWWAMHLLASGLHRGHCVVSWAFHLVPKLKRRWPLSLCCQSLPSSHHHTPSSSYTTRY